MELEILKQGATAEIVYEDLGPDNLPLNLDVYQDIIAVLYTYPSSQARFSLVGSAEYPNLVIMADDKKSVKLKITEEISRSLKPGILKLCIKGKSSSGERIIHEEELMRVEKSILSEA